MHCTHCKFSTHFDFLFYFCYRCHRKYLRITKKGQTYLPFFSCSKKMMGNCWEFDNRIHMKGEQHGGTSGDFDSPLELNMTSHQQIPNSGCKDIQPGIFRIRRDRWRILFLLNLQDQTNGWMADRKLVDIPNDWNSHCMTLFLSLVSTYDTSHHIVREREIYFSDIM